MTGTHVWIDASAGVAGDMLLGALVDAGADLTGVQQALESVIPGAVRLDRTQVDRAGQRATKVDVTVLVDDPPHRRWTEIQELLRVGRLDPEVRDRALAVFTRLADAEGHVHGIPASDVHFHEVGALDSIADVVGVCAALAGLGVTSITAGVVAVGSGRIVTAHGDIGVPVPAVAQLALGWQLTSGGRGELTTPTGMALVSTLATACEPIPPMTLRAIGIGAGSKDFPDRANVTRVMVGVRATAGERSEPGLVLEANIDDMDPRLWPGVLTQLLRDGAADAWLTPMLMKKGRPGHTLHVLCQPDQAPQMRDRIFANTTTIGIRAHLVDKHVLARCWVDVALGDSTVAIKLAHRAGLIVRATPEFDTVQTAAQAETRPTVQLLDAAVAAAERAGLTVGAPLPAEVRVRSERPLDVRELDLTTGPGHHRDDVETHADPTHRALAQEDLGEPSKLATFALGDRVEG
jgi:uncharacterized protein (TIGR00299 family) protein